MAPSTKLDDRRAALRPPTACDEAVVAGERDALPAPVVQGLPPKDERYRMTFDALHTTTLQPTAATERAIVPVQERRQRPPPLATAIDPAPRRRDAGYRIADKLAGKVALVTSGASGLGRAVAHLFALEGADVAITTLPEDAPGAALTRAAIETLGRRCIVLEGDLRDPEQCDRVVERTERAFGRIDVLVHTAACDGRVRDPGEDELDRTMKESVFPYVRLARAAIPRMRPGSSIIATSSIASALGSDRSCDFSGTEGAVHGITQSLAKELAGLRIRVNTVAPGPVRTHKGPGAAATFGVDDGAPSNDGQGRSEEIAPAFVFLASNADSGLVSGSMLVLSGAPA